MHSRMHGFGAQKDAMTLSKTELGQRVLKDRSVSLSPRQRSVFILVDGKRTVEQLLAATTAAGVTQEDIEKLLELALVADSVAPAPEGEAVEADPAPAPALAPVPVPAAPTGLTLQERYTRAYPIATRLTAELGLRGFRLNLAVEGAASYKALAELAPKIREAVGVQKFQELASVLYDDIV